MVDASQGVEAQTLANVYHAIDAGHEIVPVLNKVDLPAAEPEKVKQQIEDVIGIDASNAIMISAKTGQNVPEVLEAIVTRLQEAIAAGRLTEDRINEAVARILDLKQIDACALTDQP